MGGIRGKKVKGAGRTKNTAGNMPGPKYGMKCYDGQRVPPGTVLLKQREPNTFPGWNVSSKSFFLNISLFIHQLSPNTQYTDTAFSEDLVSSIDFPLSLSQSLYPFLPKVYFSPPTM